MVRLTKLRLGLGLAALAIAFIGLAVAVTQPALSKDNRNVDGQGLSVSSLGF